MSPPKRRSRAFERLVEQATFVVVDTETTCPDRTHRLISLAAVVVRRGERKGVWATLVNPGVHVTPWGDHRLTDEDVAGAPAFDSVVADLEALLAGDNVVFVAHNAKFDLGVLRTEYEPLGRELFDVPVLCTMRLPATVGHPVSARSLDALLESFGLSNPNRHDAASDATCTADALIELLEVAAEHGHDDLTELLQAAGQGTSSTYKPTQARPTRRAAEPSVIDEHARTHTLVLGQHPTRAELQRWVASALSCAELRCDMLADKAAAARAHAPALHKALSGRLGDLAEPGQGATLLGALNELTTAALKERDVRTWWGRHGAAIRAMPRCGDDEEICPDCRAGLICALDSVHHSLAVVACGARGSVVPQKLRRGVHTTTPKKSSGIERFCAADMPEIAGYMAWLVAETYQAESKGSQALSVVDHAVAAGVVEPRITLAYARQLALRDDAAGVEEAIDNALERRNSDPAWDELLAWQHRWSASVLERMPRPARDGVSPLIARPVGRVQPKRFRV
ncbi:MAG TPA: 3'-5' exonuclease [Acidimicrobiales bacterium]|nr:3'-5' exonuclease [Acidimicrobiales bacterium]